MKKSKKNNKNKKKIDNKITKKISNNNGNNKIKKKYIGGADHPDYDFKGCLFINTELQHDLRSPKLKHPKGKAKDIKFITRDDHKQKVFKQALRTNTGKDCIFKSNDKHNSMSKSKTEFDFFTDPGIVEKITGNSQEALLKNKIDGSGSYNKGARYQLNIIQRKNKQDSKKSVLLDFTAIKRPKKSPASERGPSINNLFRLGTGSEEHIFLVIDTGQEIVKDISISRNFKTGPGLVPVPGSGQENFLRVHIMHSPLTLGDSASKSKPDVAVWSDLFNSNKDAHIYSWIYNDEIERPWGEYIFMSDYKITSKWQDIPHAPKWKVQQEWTLKGEASKIIYDCNNSNNIPSVSREIINICYNETPPPLTTPTPTGPNKHRLTMKKSCKPIPSILKNLSYFTQRKRSGDHLQIYWASKFPNMVVTKSSSFKCLQYGGGKTPNEATNMNGINLLGLATGSPSVKWFKERTYFVTIDWPAFCYAIYSNVNTIFYRKSDPQGYLSVKCKY